eukprot:m.83382 g.83382  ORF g.83382 m.83382 type:complete len:320 (+) comp12721_c0_seq7:2069-3028(+)
MSAPHGFDPQSYNIFADLCQDKAYERHEINRKFAEIDRWHIEHPDIWLIWKAVLKAGWLMWALRESEFGFNLGSLWVRYPPNTMTNASTQDSKPELLSLIVTGRLKKSCGHATRNAIAVSKHMLEHFDLLFERVFIRSYTLSSGSPWLVCKGLCQDNPCDNGALQKRPALEYGEREGSLDTMPLKRELPLSAITDFEKHFQKGSVLVDGVEQKRGHASSAGDSQSSNDVDSALASHSTAADGDHDSELLEYGTDSYSCDIDSADDPVDGAAIEQDNKGHRLLKRLGWSSGSGLGRAQTGRKEPVTARMRAAPRLGLGFK